MGLGNESSIKSSYSDTFFNNSFLNNTKFNFPNKSNYKHYLNHSIQNSSKKCNYIPKESSNHSINLSSNHSYNLSSNHSNKDSVLSYSPSPNYSNKDSVLS